MIYRILSLFFPNIFIIFFVCGVAKSTEPVPVFKSSSALFQQFDPNVKAAKNISGLTCFSNKTCVAISDEMIAIQVFKLNLDGQQPKIEAGKEISTSFGDKCTDVSKKKKCAEVDLEGISRFKNDVYVTGSIGNKKKSGKPSKNRWFFSKIIINNPDNINAPEASIALMSDKERLEKIFDDQANTIKPYFEKPLQCYGLNVEGLANINDTIFFGLRSPIPREEGNAFLISTSMQNLATKENQTVVSKLHNLKFKDNNGDLVSDVGIRAIEELGNRLLIVTGASEVTATKKFKHWKRIIQNCEGLLSEDDKLNVSFKKNGLSRIWIWNPSSDTPPKYITTIEGNYKQKKLEGLTVIENYGKKVDLLLAFDDPKELEPLAIIKNLSIPE